MDYQSKSKEELIVELKELQQNYNSLKAIYDKDITQSKKAEDALKKSEDRFRKIVEQSPIAMAIVSMDNVIEYINQKAIRVFGYLPEDITTMDSWWVKAYPDENYRKEVVAEWMGRVQMAIKEEKEIMGNEYQVTCKDGTIKTIFISGVPVSDMILVLFDDITERKLLEEALKESEERFSKAYKTSPIAFMIANMEDGRIIEVNDAFTTISGYTHEEALNSSTLNLKIWVHEEDRRQMIATLRDGRAVVRQETTLRGKNGNVLTVLLSAQVIKLSHKYCIISSIEDITKRKQAEESLQAITTKLETLIQVSPLAITLLDIDGNVQLWNTAAEKMFGWSIQEIIGRPNPIVPANKQNEYSEWRSQIIQGKSLINQETERQRKDGSLISISISSSPLYDEQGNVIGRMAIMSDISARKIAEQELIKAKERAEESDRLKTAFLQNMSHEIRTPMNAIMGFSSLLVENYDHKDKLAKFSEIINLNCNDLLVIINDLLDIAKIESGQLPINNEECNLNELFSEITSFFTRHQKRIGKQQINFSMQAHCDQTENIIVTDKVKLKQIFINLIGNAFKFTDAGKIESGCKIDANRKLVFYVSDTGIGIPPDKQDVIFERFAQLNQGANKLTTGTGLGLSIAKGLVKLLGGKIWLESELENLSAGKTGGTTFYFSFPYKIAQSSIIEQVSTDENKEYHFFNKTLLFVEDDFYNAAYIKEILSNTGLNIIHTEYGYKAVQIALAQSPDLVLMDMRLPDLNGYEATRQIKQHKPGLKIIAQTAYAAHDDKQKAFNAGCDDYISKPTKKDVLLSIIKRHLSKQ
jgi:PAS domain S-box-containing protein